MLFGRDSERARIRGLLQAARDSHGRVLVLLGEPGVGKTALLQEAHAQASGMEVLRARGVESESELPFAALHQLLRPALGAADELPAPQAAALRGALGLADGGVNERFLVSAACLTLLADRAEHRPLLCLVDDAHWLDGPSADALLFVARRLESDRIVMLFAARQLDGRGFEAADLPSLELGGLDAEASAELLQQRTGAATAPQVRARLLEVTRGNALALLELPSGLTDAQLAGSEPLPQEVPLTQRVERLFGERVRRLPEPTQRLLLIAAADDTGAMATVARAGAILGLSPEALTAAEQAGLIEAKGGRLEFRHPLVRSAVYGSAASGDRRTAHRSLAEALAGDEQHADRSAWHLAAATLEPDEEVVRALEQAAGRAEGRAGHAAAARALERAAELSADPEARGERLVGAARATRSCGPRSRGCGGCIVHLSAALGRPSCLDEQLEGLARVQPCDVGGCRHEQAAAVGGPSAGDLVRGGPPAGGHRSARRP